MATATIFHCDILNDERPTLKTTQARERWMKGELHLILQIKISTRQQLEQVWQISRKLTAQIGFDQRFNG